MTSSNSRLFLLCLALGFIPALLFMVADVMHAFMATTHDTQPWLHTFIATGAFVGFVAIIAFGIGLLLYGLAKVIDRFR